MIEYDNKKLVKSRKSHGGDIYSGGLSDDFIDLSSNINPGIIPNEVYIKLPEILEKARAYPDLEYKKLKIGVSEYLNDLVGNRLITTDMLITGNGASEITDKCISLFKKVLIPVPSFTEYQESAIRHGLKIEFLEVYKGGTPSADSIETSRGYSFFEEIIKHMEEDTLLILTNPNNPDGQILNMDALTEYLKIAEANNWYTLIDETFGEYLDNNDMALRLVDKFQNLIVIKAMTKFFCLPGLRLGYAISKNNDILYRIEALQTPWSVGTFEENIALIMIKDKGFRVNSKEDNKINRRYLLEKLRDINFFQEVYDSKSNFIMAKLKSNKVLGASELTRALREKGVLIRNLFDMKGLTGEFIRIAVKEKDKTDRLVKEISKIVEINDF